MYKLYVFFFLLAFLPLSAYTLENTYIQNYKNQLFKLNNAFEGFQYKNITDYISYDIIDQKRQKIGTVQDFLINDSGGVARIIAELNRLDLDPVILSLTYDDIWQQGDLFMMADLAADMEEKLATFLAQIETAASPNGDKLISINRLKNSYVLCQTVTKSDRYIRLSPNKTQEELSG